MILKLWKRYVLLLFNNASVLFYKVFRPFNICSKRKINSIIAGIAVDT